mmetsp:Transcript_16622/g.29106  ORF Transcript_16622/g.29106 Transcript_16622/m.29106 type:complete len:360 (+) Transcript_16622:52-1131(+)
MASDGYAKPKSKAVDSLIYLQGRDRPVTGEIMGRQVGDAERLFPRHTHASAATTGEVAANGKVLKLWTFSQLETLNSSSLRQRAMAIKDFLGEGRCPPLPSGMCQDLVRWILHMQEQITAEGQSVGRSSGYGNGHYIPPSFAQDSKERPIDGPAASERTALTSRQQRTDVTADRDHYQDLKNQQNEFKEDRNNGIQSGRAGGEGRRHLFPKQNMVHMGLSSAEPQGIQTLKDTQEGRRYIAPEDHIRDQQQDAMEAVNTARSARTAVGGPSHHVSESHMAYYGCADQDDPPIGGERRSHAHIPQDHIVSNGIADGVEAVHGRKYLDGFQKNEPERGRQDDYQSSWKKKPSRLLGSSMIV